MLVLEEHKPRTRRSFTDDIAFLLLGVTGVGPPNDWEESEFPELPGYAVEGEAVGADIWMALYEPISDHGAPFTEVEPSELHL